MEYIYGALLLHKLGQPINEENLTKVLRAAGASVDDAKLRTLIASLNGIDLASEIANASAAMVAAPASEAAPAKEAKKEEEKPAESAAGLASLFG